MVIVPDDEDLLDDDFENDDQIILVPLGRIKKLLNNMVLESKWIMGFPEWMEGLTKNHIKYSSSFSEKKEGVSVRL